MNLNFLSIIKDAKIINKSGSSMKRFSLSNVFFVSVNPLISWCGNFRKCTVFKEFRVNRPRFWGNCVFPQEFRWAFSILRSVCVCACVCITYESIYFYVFYNFGLSRVYCWYPEVSVKLNLALSELPSENIRLYDKLDK